MASGIQPPSTALFRELQSPAGMAVVGWQDEAFECAIICLRPENCNGTGSDNGVGTAGSARNSILTLRTRIPRRLSTPAMLPAPRSASQLRSQNHQRHRLASSKPRCIAAPRSHLSVVVAAIPETSLCFPQSPTEASAGGGVKRTNNILKNRFRLHAWAEVVSYPVEEPGRRARRSPVIPPLAVGTDDYHGWSDDTLW